MAKVRNDYFVEVTVWDHYYGLIVVADDYVSAARGGIEHIRKLTNQHVEYMNCRMLKDCGPRVFGMLKRYKNQKLFMSNVDPHISETEVNVDRELDC